MAIAERSSGSRRAPTAPSWSQERRLEFIEFRLLWDGRINRGELVEFFDISIQQASLDIARYTELAPGNLEYDKSEKTYRATPKMRCLFVQPDSQYFLNQLSGPPSQPAAFSFIGWRPPHDVVRYPTRSIRAEILMRVIWAIRDRQEIDVSYQSMRQAASTRRQISPHAIAFNGFRWHARAWCHENHYFKDFVLARIQEVHGAQPSAVDPSGDSSWHSFATVILRASRSLSLAQRAAVEAEFGIKKGELRVSMRQALVHYFVRQLSLDRTSPSADTVQLLEWVNARELQTVIAEAGAR